MRRLIVCLDVKAGRVVKGVHFRNLRDQGEPSQLASDYERQGADEIVFLDVSATAEERATHLDIVRRTAEQLFIPLTVGGGIRDIDDVARTLRSGADKVAINSAAVDRPGVITEVAQRFGSQCAVISIDASREYRGWGGQWRVYTRGAQVPTALDAVSWAAECVERGAGEILLTSIDRDGTRKGYDVDLIEAVTQVVNVPVIASGGAGSAADVIHALEAGADAALVAGIVHDGIVTLASIKGAMAAAGVPVRASHD